MLLLGLISLLVTFYCQYPLLINKYAINDDVRQDIYPYQRFRDNELFKNDIIADFYFKWNPWGLTAAYYLISFFFDPVQATKILPFILCLVSTIFIFKSGNYLRGKLCGFFSALVFLFVCWSREILDAFGKSGAASFGLLFFTVGVYYYLKEDFIKTCILLVLLLIFYPPLFFIYGLTSVFLIFSRLTKGHSLTSREWKIIFLSLITIAIILILRYFQGGQLRLVTQNQARVMEEFYPGGRRPVFFSSMWQQFANYETGLAIDYPLIWLFVLSFLIVLIFRRSRIALPSKLWFIIAASVIMFIIAKLFMFTFHGPARYMRSSLPIFLILFIAINVDRFMAGLNSRRDKIIYFISAVILILVIFLPKLQRYHAIAPFPRLYNFIQTLPKDSIIAGHPTLMDNVPTFGKRAVFINEETSLPYYSVFYPLMKDRTYTFFAIYYSGSLREIHESCLENNIDYLVIYKPHFSKSYLAEGNFYLNPFNEHIKQLVKGKSSFALMGIPRENRLFEDNDIFIVEVKDINKLIIPGDR